MARTAKQELQRALRSRSRKLPAVSDDAKRLFYEIARKSGLRWSDLQRKTKDGQNVFEMKHYRVVIIDVRMLAANDRSDL